MMELLSKLGIDYKLLIAQIVNFLVLLFILYRFAYRPVLAMLEKRARRIEKGLKDAAEAKKELEAAYKKEEEILKKAHREAKNIIEKMHKQAEKAQAEIIVETKKQTDKMVKDAKVQIEREKEKTVQEIKAEIGSLVVAAAEKVIGERVDEKKDKELIERAIQ